MISVKAQTKKQQFNEAYKIVNTITSDKLTKKQKKALVVYKKLAPAMIITDANKDLPKNKIPNKSIYIAHASVGSVVVKKLIKKYGGKFVRKKLPRKIFSKLPKKLQKKISYRRFLNVYDKVINGAAPAVAGATYKGLRKLGVPKWLAGAGSSIVYAIVWWYVS